MSLWTTFLEHFLIDTLYLNETLCAENYRVVQLMLEICSWTALKGNVI